MVEQAPDIVQQFVNKFADQHPTQENIDTFYNSIDPEDYRQYLVRINSTEPFRIADAISDQASEDGYGCLNLDKASKIYDVGAGAGIIGELLSAKGYTSIEGGDASEGLLSSTANKGWYTHTEIRWFGQGVDKLPADKIGTFDCVTATGVWLLGHIPCAGFEDCHALLKTGGHFVTAMRS